MGRRVMARPPKYVHGFIDRHGKPRFYLRRKGYAKVPLPGLPWSPEFMEAYERALEGRPEPIGGKRIASGSMRALAVSYYQSSAFTELERSTQQSYRNVIDRFCKEHGDKSALKLQAGHIVKLLDARPTGPANWLLKVLRAMYRHAVAVNMRDDDPTRDIRNRAVKGDGYHSWTEGEIAQYEAAHPIGSKARLALALLVCTGQRRSDVVLMGRQHIQEDGTLYVRQKKTGAELWIPIHPDLAKIVDGTPADHLTFLTTQFGRGYTSGGFGHWFRQQCDAAGLPANCSAHGLRKAAARRLADSGCSVHEIAAITGHASLKEVERYTKGANQKRLARSAMDKMRT
jgi:integrase